MIGGVIVLLFSSVALKQKFWGEWGVKIDNILVEGNVFNGTVYI